MNIAHEVAGAIDMQLAEIQSLIKIFYKLSESIDASEWLELQRDFISGLYHLDDQIQRVLQQTAILSSISAN